MEKKRFLLHATVGLLLIRDNKILLMKRINTGYMDGYYAVVAGHLEENENLKQAMIRESFEEVGIVIKEEDVTISSVIRRGDNDNYFNYYLTTKRYEGVPFIKEKDKCKELIWCCLESLPDNMIANDKRAVYNYLNNITFDEYDFSSKIMVKK